MNHTRITGLSFVHFIEDEVEPPLDAQQLQYMELRELCVQIVRYLQDLDEENEEIES